MNNLKRLRKTQKITQNALAMCLGVSQGTVSNYESGRRTPGLQSSRKVVRALQALGVQCSLLEAFPEQAISSAEHDKTLTQEICTDKSGDHAVHASSSSEVA